jgi:hypothetical protein
MTGPLQPSGDSPAAKAARRLVDAVLGRRGRLDPSRRLLALRHGAAATGVVAEPGVEELGGGGELVDKVARHAYRVSEDDIAAAQRAGYSDDEVFDLIVSTAVGAGMARRALGHSAVDRWEAGG